MNERAKCVNEKCSAFGIEKSVPVGQMLGYGAANDRVRCPTCGELMRTTRTSPSNKGPSGKRVVGRRYPTRSLGSGRRLGSRKKATTR